jgi:hypothetical protein
MERAARRTGLAVLAAALGLGLAPAATRADVLRLENGRALHGSVDRGYVDREALRVQLFTTGGVVRVRWEHLIPEDRDAWQVALGLKDSSEALVLKVEAHKLLFTNASTMLGLVLNPEALDGPPAGEVRIQEKGKVVVMPRGQVARVEPVMLEIGLVFTPRQAYERKREELSPNTGPSHFDLAEYARQVGAYEEAKEHLLKAKEDPEFLLTGSGKLVESKLALLEILLKHRALKEELDRVNVRLIEARSSGRDFTRGAKIYLEARDVMYRLMTETTDKKVKDEFRMEDLARRVEKERREFFQRRLPPEVYRWLRQTAWEKAREQKVKDIPPGTDRQAAAILQMKGTFEGARQYFQRQVAEDLWNHLIKAVGAGEQLAEIDKIVAQNPTKLTPAEKERATRLAELDKGLRGELLDFWKNREKKGGATTSYGYGTFIVVKSDLKLTRKPPAANQGGGRRGGGGGGGAAGPPPADVVKTPDQWWEEASGQERLNWLLSYCAERAGTSGLLEIVREENVPCDGCSGLGYRKTSEASTGEETVTRCPTCNGCKVIRKIRWR